MRLTISHKVAQIRAMLLAARRAFAGHDHRKCQLQAVSLSREVLAEQVRSLESEIERMKLEQENVRLMSENQRLTLALVQEQPLRRGLSVIRGGQ